MNMTYSLRRYAQGGGESKLCSNVIHKLFPDFLRVIRGATYYESQFLKFEMLHHFPQPLSPIWWMRRLPVERPKSLICVFAQQWSSMLKRNKICQG